MDIVFHGRYGRKRRCVCWVGGQNDAAYVKFITCNPEPVLIYVFSNLLVDMSRDNEDREEYSTTEQFERRRVASLVCEDEKDNSTCSKHSRKCSSIVWSEFENSQMVVA